MTRRPRRIVATVSIRHCQWRHGCPRFTPGPALRAMGFKSHDLKYQDGARAGQWYSFEDAQRFALAIEQEIAALRAKAPAKKRARPAAPMPLPGRATPPVTASIGHVVGGWLIRRAAASAPDARAATGARAMAARPLSLKTLVWYTGLAKRLEVIAPDVWAHLADEVDPAFARTLYERLNAAIGHASARGIMALCSAAFADGRLRDGPLKGRANPFEKLRIPQAEPRTRVGSPAEITALVAAADAMGRPEIGDMVLLGVWTGQRQNDRLALTLAADRQRVELRQSKTGAAVSIRVAAPLAARLAAAMARRAGRGIASRHAVIDEARGEPWEQDTYVRAFARVRDAAAKALPSVATLRDQDLRDTAVTWLARAGCTIPEICAITGHQLGTATAVLKHYMQLDHHLADSAVDKLTAWAKEG